MDDTKYSTTVDEKKKEARGIQINHDMEKMFEKLK